MTVSTENSKNQVSGENSKKRSFDLVTTSVVLISSMVALGLVASLSDDVARIFEKSPTTGGKNLLETPALSVDIFQAEDKLKITVPPQAFISNINQLCMLIDAQFSSDCKSSLGPLENKGPFGKKKVEVILPVEDGNVILGGFMGSDETIPDFVSALSLAEAGDRFTASELFELTKKVGTGTLNVSAALAALWLAGTGYKRLSAAKQAKLERRAIEKSESKHVTSSHKPATPNIPKPDRGRIETIKLLNTPPGQIVQTKSPADILAPLLGELTRYPSEHPDGHPNQPQVPSDEILLQELQNEMYLKVGMPEQVKTKKQPGIWSH